jgi:hypothetical protein
MRRLLAILLFAIVAAAAPAHAQQARTASVQGAVVKVATGEAIPSAVVELRSLDGAGRFYSTTSERDGTFAFRNITPGPYQLTAMRPGYVRGDFGLRGPGGSGVTVTLAAGQRLPDVRLAMRAAGTISGRVTDRIGAPAGNIHVKALRFAYLDGRVSLIDVKSVFTNDLGEYRLGWLPPGLYNVSALHPEAAAQTLNLPEVINSAMIVGTVATNAGGMNGGSFGSTGSGDPAVRSRMGLQPGEDYVPVYYPGTFDQRSAAVLEVRSGAELPGIDLVVSPVRTASISGVVRPMPSTSGASYGRVMVKITRNPAFNARSEQRSVDPVSGAFQIGGLAPGSYAFVSVFGGGDSYVGGAAIADVSDGSVASVDVVLDHGVKIPVVITTDGPLQGVDASTLRVFLRPDLAASASPDTAPASRGADGTLALASVVPGDYVVNVAPLMTVTGAASMNPPPAVPGVQGFADPRARQAAAIAAGLQSAYVKAIRYGGVDLAEGRLHLAAGPPPGVLEIVVAGGSGQLDGHVLDVQRKPAANVTVVLVPVARGRLDLYKVTTSDSTGRFHVANIPPHDYTAFAWEDVETGSWLDPQMLRFDEGLGAPVRIAEGASVTTELTMIPAR